MWLKPKPCFETIVVLLLVLLNLNVSFAAPWSVIEKRGLIAATEAAFPPFNFYEGTKLSGFEVELGEALAKTFNLPIAWKSFGFDALLMELNMDHVDFVIASHGITPERASAVDFTNPHYCTGGIVLTKAGGPTTAANLATSKLGVQVGSSYLRHLQILKLKNIKTYPKDSDVLQSLLAGRIDAMVTDRFLALDSIQKNPGKNLITGDLLFEEKVGIAVAKGNSELLFKLNNALLQVLQDGTYAKLSHKYFGKDIRCQ